MDVILGLVLLVAGAVCVYVAVRAHAMLAAETLSVPELEQLRGVSDELGAAGGFRKVCEVVGAAAPGLQGVLNAELTGTECVWHGHRVQRRYKHYDRDSDGDTRVTTRTETVAEHSSAPGFTIVRDGHVIAVDHGGKRPDGVEQVADRFEESRQRTGSWLRELVGGDRDDTIGFQYTEWALRPGTPSTVGRMGFLDGLTGNASRVDPAAVAQEYGRLFAQGEQVHAAYQLVRDVFLFTDRRLILLDKQGMTGRKVSYHSVPYKSITHFTVETAGAFDLDAELTIWISGGQGITKQFGRGVDVYEVQALLAAFVAR